MNFTDLRKNNVKQLRQICKQNNIYGYTKRGIKRADLLRLLESKLCISFFSDIMIDDVFLVISQWLSDKDFYNLMPVSKGVNYAITIEKKKRLDIYKKQQQEEGSITKHMIIILSTLMNGSSIRLRHQDLYMSVVMFLGKHCDWYTFRKSVHFLCMKKYIYTNGPQCQTSKNKYSCDPNNITQTQKKYNRLLNMLDNV